MKKLLNKIRRWWGFEGRYYHRDVQNGIKNLIKWFPIIWKDRDWDSAYIFDILKFKLENQAKSIGGNDRHVGAQIDAQKMRLCARLIEKIRSDFYELEYADYHKTEIHWDELSKESKDDIREDMEAEGTDVFELRELRIETISENFDDYYNKYPLIFKKVMNLPETAPTFSWNKSREGIAMNIARINHERALNLLFRLLETHIEGWWD